MASVQVHVCTLSIKCLPRSIREFDVICVIDGAWYKPNAGLVFIVEDGFIDN